MDEASGRRRERGHARSLNEVEDAKVGETDL